MICKQSIVDTLLRLKDSSNYDNNNNRIASLMAKPQDSRTKEQKETLCAHVLNQLMDQYKQNNNNIASTVTPTKIGEVAEFQSLLKGIR